MGFENITSIDMDTECVEHCKGLNSKINFKKASIEDLISETVPKKSTNVKNFVKVDES